ncbi:ribosome biogenesis GTP-binding protein YihA/YsxC [Bacillus sp. FJAT-47783]|uniref:ribosome biogenesis GTP-binding protein YihA/YsxC n=1 Tax=Bacillus sp. FJAT-47783 TaxID=2922712 RepID=UPI001FAD32E1|nr:ribosome biogenesis GTP-binding protein YihA/YsxC [Bacillus sp. FJAT-47783]
MKIKSAEIVISAVKKEQYPNEGIPEIALAGRSNVGKSSFINKLLNRKNLARTSSKPGKTQTLNFYMINEQFHFVDVPGYGFAKVSKKEREAWGKMIETYLTTRDVLKAVVLIVDVRHAPTNDDVMMYDFLKYYEIPVIVVATKADKIPKGKWEKHLKVVRETLEMEAGDELILFSSETGKGKNEAWAVLLKAMGIKATD